MDLEQATAAILSNTYTRLDSSRRLSVLQDFMDHAQYGGEASAADISQAIVERYRPTTDAAPAAAVSAWGNDVLNFILSGGPPQLNALKTALNVLPDLIVYVAVRLDDATVSAIGQWSRANVDPKVLLTMRIDPAVMGGCALVWKDAYWDFSLPYFIDKHQAELTALMEKYHSTRV